MRHILTHFHKICQKNNSLDLSNRSTEDNPPPHQKKHPIKTLVKAELRPRKKLSVNFLNNLFQHQQTKTKTTTTTDMRLL